MNNIMYTYEEQERAAIVSGDNYLAELLEKIILLEKENEELLELTNNLQFERQEMQDILKSMNKILDFN